MSSAQRSRCAVMVRWQIAFIPGSRLSTAFLILWYWSGYWLHNVDSKNKLHIFLLTILMVDVSLAIGWRVFLGSRVKARVIYVIWLHYAIDKDQWLRSCNLSIILVELLCHLFFKAIELSLNAWDSFEQPIKSMIGNCGDIYCFCSRFLFKQIKNALKCLILRK